MAEHISKRKRFCKTAFRIERAIRVIRTQAFLHSAYKSFDNCMIRDNVVSALRLIVYIPSSNTVNTVNYIVVKRCKRYTKSFTIEFMVGNKSVYVLTKELIEILKYLDCDISHDVKSGIYKISVYNSDKVCLKTCGHTVPKIEIANGKIVDNEYEKMFNEILASKIVHKPNIVNKTIVNKTTVTKVGSTVTKPVSNKTIVTKPIKVLAVETNFVTMKSEIDTLDIELNKLNTIIYEHEKQLKLAKSKLQTMAAKRNKLKTEMIELVKSI